MKKIIKYLEDNYSDFSKSFKKITDYIIHNQTVISFISINDLAKATDTSPATITRFSKEIGFKGYPSFQKVFQVEAEVEASYMKNLKTSITESENENVLQNIVKTNIELLESMDIDVLETKIEKLSDIINKGNKLFILGARGSYPLAYYLYYMLKEIRENVALVMIGSTDFTDKLLYSKKEDVLLTISFHPYSNFSSEVTKFFKENGSKVISITDKEDSVIGNMSDLAINIKHGSKAHTFVPSIVVVNSILTKIALENKDETIERLDKLKEITDRFKIYNDK